MYIFMYTLGCPRFPETVSRWREDEELPFDSMHRRGEILGSGNYVMLMLTQRPTTSQDYRLQNPVFFHPDVCWDSMIHHEIWDSTIFHRKLPGFAVLLPHLQVKETGLAWTDRQNRLAWIPESLGVGFVELVSVGKNAMEPWNPMILLERWARDDNMLLDEELKELQNPQISTRCWGNCNWVFGEDEKLMEDEKKLPYACSGLVFWSWFDEDVDKNKDAKRMMIKK